MRDPASIFTSRGTPVILIASRAVFLSGAVFLFLSARNRWFPASGLNPYWVFYLLALYVGCELIYRRFSKKNIDLAFAFPLVLSIFALHFVSVLIGAQERLPLINRAEHLTSFILLGYIVWIFFLKYLPQNVWQRHPYYTAWLVLSVTSLAGAGNEIFELFFDRVFQTNMVGAGYDTSLDLLMNTLGSGLFLAVRLILIAGRQTDN